LFYVHTCIQTASTILTPLYPICLSPSLVSTPGQDVFYLPVLHFLNVYCLFKGFHLGISHWRKRKNWINSPLLLTLSLSPCSPIIQQFTVHFIILSSYKFTLSHSLLLPSPSHSPLRQAPLLQSHSLSLSFCECIYIYIYIYIYI
jgi:hypothetical protein